MKSKLKKKTKHQDVIFPHHHAPNFDVEKAMKNNDVVV